jgi:hypothetical protein
MTVEALPLIEQHADARRTISETVIRNGNEITRVTQIDINSGHNVLGNHFHLAGIEQFHLVSGVKVSLFTQDTNVGGPIEEQVLNAPALIDIAPGIAHTFVFTTPGILLSRNVGEFNPHDMHPVVLAT